MARKKDEDDARKDSGKQKSRRGRTTIITSGGYAPPAPPERRAQLDIMAERLRAAEKLDESRMVGGGGSRFHKKPEKTPR